METAVTNAVLDHQDSQNAILEKFFASPHRRSQIIKEISDLVYWELRHQRQTKIRAKTRPNSRKPYSATRGAGSVADSASHLAPTPEPYSLTQRPYSITKAENLPPLHAVSFGKSASETHQAARRAGSATVCTSPKAQKIPAQSQIPSSEGIYHFRCDIGAGDGNRTRLCSLGSCHSTDELHPRGCSHYRLAMLASHIVPCLLRSRQLRR